MGLSAGVRETNSNANLVLRGRVIFVMRFSERSGRNSPIFDNSKIEYQISNLGEYLPLRPKNLITKIILPLNTKFAFEFVSRTPADKPIVCAALTQWSSGRTRLTLGGYGKSPMLAMDGTEAEGIESAARTAYHEANDEWASAEYRMDVAAVLAKRCMEAI